MKTILAPIDFSAASRNSANYALDFAHAINASLTLLYVYQFPMAASEAPVSATVIDQMIEDAEKAMLEWKEEYRHKASGKVKIYGEIKQGYITSQIEAYCKHINPYAVVMGSHGSGAIERVLFGSSTLSAMKHLTWPLVIVPGGARFTSISKVGLACDLRHVTESIHADEIRKLVNDFHAQLHILHINTDKYKMISDAAIEGSEWLRDMFADLKPEFHFLNKENIEEAINEFAEKKNLDLLILIPKKHGLLEGIFHKSHTKEMALNTHMPLVSIHE